jgi:hypothetical protein
MRTNKIVALLAATALIIAFVIRYVSLAAFDLNQNYFANPSSKSSEEAQRDGLLFAKAKMDPGSFAVVGQNLQFVDVWIEHTSKIQHDYMLFEKRVRKNSGYSICFQLSANSLKWGTDWDGLDQDKDFSRGFEISGVQNTQVMYFYRLPNKSFCADVGSIEAPFPVRYRSSTRTGEEPEAKFTLSVLE